MTPGRSWGRSSIRFLARWTTTQKVAVVLNEASTTNKVVQTVLEMVRGGIRDLPVTLTVFHDGPADAGAGFVASPGFPLRRLEGNELDADRALRAILQEEAFDYVILFESSGMYNGEDIATLASHLSLGRLDAVWGSRRLSVRDIHESYRLKYRHRTMLGAISYAGSHALSLLYLALFGRYVSDTLSAARAIRVRDAVSIPVPLTHKMANQHLLSALLRRKAEMFEVPVQFFSISPEQVRRTTPIDGVRAIMTAVSARLRAPVTPATAPAPVGARASWRGQRPLNRPMDRLLVIPAAGLGSRLGAHTPKLLAQVNGRPMLDHLLSLYAPVVDRVALVVHPAARGAVMHVLDTSGRADVDVFVQEQPTGMLDAILLARAAVETGRPRRVWITWCDQVAIHPRTVARLAEADGGDPLVALPTCTGPDPYVHLARDPSGRIVRVLHRREGDVMPAVGESDAGLFSLVTRGVPGFAGCICCGADAPAPRPASGTSFPSSRGRASAARVVTFPCTEPIRGGRRQHAGRPRGG